MRRIRIKVDFDDMAIASFQMYGPRDRFTADIHWIQLPSGRWYPTNVQGDLTAARNIGLAISLLNPYRPDRDNDWHPEDTLPQSIL